MLPLRPNRALQGTGHATIVSPSFCAFCCVSRQLSWVFGFKRFILFARLNIEERCCEIEYQVGSDDVTMDRSAKSPKLGTGYLDIELREQKKD